MKKLPQRLIYLVTGLGGVALMVIAFRPTPVPVDLKEVRLDSLQVTVEAEGETRLRSQFVVSAPIAGKLERIDWDEGDQVMSHGTNSRGH